MDRPLSETSSDLSLLLLRCSVSPSSCFQAGEDRAWRRKEGVKGRKLDRRSSSRRLSFSSFLSSLPLSLRQFRDPLAPPYLPSPPAPPQSAHHLDFHWQAHLADSLFPFPSLSSSSWSYRRRPRGARRCYQGDQEDQVKQHLYRPFLSISDAKCNLSRVSGVRWIRREVGKSRAEAGATVDKTKKKINMKISSTPTLFFFS